MELIFIAAAAFAGGVLAALLGWLDSKEDFDPRKFGKSLGFALLAALGFAITYSLTGNIGVRDIFLAILGGAGWDVLTNRALGAAGSRP